MNTGIYSLFTFALTVRVGHGIWIWELEPSILIGLVVWTAGYLVLTGPLRQRYPVIGRASRARQVAFHTGTLVALIALISPLDYLADHFLLSAHMVQHLLLLMVAPPLWLIGMPPLDLEGKAVPAIFKRLFQQITHPIAAFIIYNAILFGWHVPQAYDAALYHPGWHIIEHLSFLAIALLAWWPVLGFLPRLVPRANGPSQLFYLFMMMLSSTLLGAILTLANYPIYPFYLTAPGVVHGLVLPSAAGGPRLWGLLPLADQQISGLIMWIPGNMLYFGALMIVLSGWLRSQEKQAREREALEFGATDLDNR